MPCANQGRRRDGNRGGAARLSAGEAQGDPRQGNRRRARLRRPGPRPIAQHEGQRRQRHRRPAREDQGWDLAAQDGWVPGKTLFPLEEAAQRGTIIQYLLSDAGQKDYWPTLKPLSDRRQGAVLLARLQHRLQRPDRRGAAEGHRRDPGRAERLRHDGAPAVPGRQGHQRQLRHSSGRDRPGAGPLPGAAASPSAPATCSRRPSRRKSSAT